MNVSTFMHLDEVTWVGIQALIAGGGLLGLFAYTVFTWQMKKYAQDTWRAGFTPVLSLADSVFGKSEANDVDFTFRNVGEGPALDLRFWHQYVKEDFALLISPLVLFEAGISATHCKTNGADLLKSETRSLRASFFLGNPRLYILEAKDIAQGIHQLQVLISKRGVLEIRRVSKLGDSWITRRMRKTVIEPFAR